MYDDANKYQEAQAITKFGGPMLSGGNLSTRLDYQIAELEKHLARLKQAKDVLARNPDYEFLADSLRHL